MALNKAAAMKPSDRVLVHAAAGGVGLAAIQVVQVGYDAFVAPSTIPSLS
jgi:NADPH:quinone reductase-like Zn-dependent oxidoreductase